MPKPKIIVRHEGAPKPPAVKDVPRNRLFELKGDLCCLSATGTYVINLHEMTVSPLPAVADAKVDCVLPESYKLTITVE